MKKRLLQSLFFILVLLISVSRLSAQPILVDEKRFPLDPQLTYDTKVPSPEQFLGYKLGQEYTLYAHSVSYFKALDVASDRVTLNQYGQTYEGRPLINLVITSPKNQSNLEALRQKHLKLLDPNAPIDKNDPIFVSMSYNIHGNETSSTEAAMQVAYRLAAATDDETLKILDHSVIILYICINPDGRDRYIYWYKSAQRNVLGFEPRDYEHVEPWPGGRGNHYWFDVNRDWVWNIHPETRGLIEEYQKWMPQAHVDYHEQGYNNNYFTMPGTTPRNKILPDTYEALSDTFGMANVREFDKHRISYFTRDQFDFFFPGYGSSYPSVMGAIAMLVEQGGIGAGRAVETDDGYVLTLRQRIFDHYTTSMATIKKSIERRETLFQYSKNAWNPATSKSPTQAYYLSATSAYTNEIIAMLLRHGVKVDKATQDFTVADAKNYKTGQLMRKNLPAGTFVISTQQARHLFINTILERSLAIEDSVMYDMATWSAILAYNLDGYSSNTKVSVSTQPVTIAPKSIGNVINPNAQYGFVIDWKQRNAPQALAQLWKKGYRVRVSDEPFGDGKTTFAAGALIILLERNMDKLGVVASELQEIATATGIQIQGFDSGRMKIGMDLASARNTPVKAPRVALLIDAPFSSTTAGQISYLFDYETGLPIQRIKGSNLQQTSLPKFGDRYGNADLNNFDVLIIPDGGGGLGEVFKNDQFPILRDWINRGGVVVATEGAAAFFTANRSRFTDVKLVEPKRDTSEGAKFVSFVNREDYYGKKRTPGTALNGTLDVSHPLAFGMENEVYTLKLDNTALLPNADLQTVGRYVNNVDKLLAAGYISQENQKMLAGTTFAGVLPLGKGKIVFLTDNTQYRMFWRGPSRMMQNAVMILPGY